MVDLSIWGPILGGCIAATAGIIGQFIALWLQKRRRQKNWENRLERLTTRLTIPGSVDEMSEIDVKEYMKTYADVMPLLEDHMASAPESVSDEVFVAYERLYRTRTNLEVDYGDIDEAEKPSVRGIVNKVRKLRRVVGRDE